MYTYNVHNILFLPFSRNHLSFLSLSHFFYYVTDPPSVSLNPSIAAVESDNVSITCTVFGIPPPEITWTRNNTNITSLTDYITILESGSGKNRTSTLMITDISKADESRYTCSAFNGVENLIGSITERSSTITVQGMPKLSCSVNY